MTTYVDIETSQEAIEAEEELIEAVEAFVDAMSVSLWTHFTNELKEIKVTIIDLLCYCFPMLVEYSKGTRSLLVDVESLLLFAALTIVAVVLFSPNVSFFRHSDRNEKSWWKRWFSFCITKKNREGDRRRSKEGQNSCIRRQLLLHSHRISSQQSLFEQQRYMSHSDNERNYDNFNSYSNSWDYEGKNVPIEKNWSVMSRLYDCDPTIETEEERFQRLWPIYNNRLSSTRKYHKLILPPTCRRILLSSSATSTKNATTAKSKVLSPPTSSSNKKNPNHVVSEEFYEDNPALRLQNYLLQIWIFIRSIISFDYMRAVSMIVSWIQSIRRLREYRKRDNIEPAQDVVDDALAIKNDELLQCNSSSTITRKSSLTGRESSIGTIEATGKVLNVADDSESMINNDDENDSATPIATPQRLSKYNDKIIIEEDHPSLCTISTKNGIENGGEDYDNHSIHSFETAYGTTNQQYSLDCVHDRQQSERYKVSTGIFKPIVTKNDSVVRRKSKVSIQTIDTSSETATNNMLYSQSVWEEFDSNENDENSELQQELEMPINQSKQEVATANTQTSVLGIPYRRTSRMDPTQQSLKHFFDTADSQESLQQLALDSLVPDKHGYILSEHLLPDYRNDTPLLVFVNTRSGPQQGHILIAQFRRLLNPIQVWDLNDGGPEAILESFSVFSRLRLLVCGGDGTVAWIISALEKLDVYNNKNKNNNNNNTNISGKPPRNGMQQSKRDGNNYNATRNRQWPPIAILPLGTGNDLARIHGWGGGYNNESLITILEQISESYASLLDRWELTITDSKSKKQEKKTFFNYLGVGADAQAALQVHYLRESRPEWFFSRLVNKAMYGLFGAEDIIKASNVHTRKHLKLIADGVEIPLPHDSQGIILLNIDAYAGGVPLWSYGTKPPPSPSSSLSAATSSKTQLRRSRSLSDTSNTSRSNSNSLLFGGMNTNNWNINNNNHNNNNNNDNRDLSSSNDDSRVVLSMEERYAQVTSCDLPSSCQDGILDIVSIRGAFHLGQIKVGLSTAQRLCQCREVTIVISNKVAVQVDGEPWRQSNCTLTIKRKNDQQQGQAIMLHKSSGDEYGGIGGVEMEMSRLLDWAEERNMIDNQVHTILMKEFSRRIESKKRQRRVQPKRIMMSSSIMRNNNSNSSSNFNHHEHHNRNMDTTTTSSAASTNNTIISTLKKAMSSGAMHNNNSSNYNNDGQQQQQQNPDYPMTSSSMLSCSINNKIAMNGYNNSVPKTTTTTTSKPPPPPVPPPAPTPTPQQQSHNSATTTAASSSSSWQAGWPFFS